MSETREQAATRRRWVTLAEVVAVAGLLIGALTLWLSWSERRADDAERREERVAADRAKAEERGRIGLVATEADGGTVAFKGVACALQSTDLSFPSALGVEAQNTVLDHRIDADWFEKPLKKALAAARQERGRLPVLIASRCTGEDGDRLETAIYDVPYRLDDGGLFGGKSLKLQGLILRERVPAARGQARLDALWKASAPKPKA